MTLEIQCPMCGSMMEPMPATEWSLHGQRSVRMLCPNCTHTEEAYFTIRRDEESPDGAIMDVQAHCQGNPR